MMMMLDKNTIQAQLIHYVVNKIIDGENIYSSYM